MDAWVAMAGLKMQKYMTACKAKTRTGTRCKRRPSSGRNRCALHGGKSLVGGGHPNYKHGYYSKYDLHGITLIESRRTRQCTEYKKDGTRCRQWAMHNDALRRCVAHSNGIAEFERIMRKLKFPRKEWSRHKESFFRLLQRYSEDYY